MITRYWLLSRRTRSPRYLLPLLFGSCAALVAACVVATLQISAAAASTKISVTYLSPVAAQVGQQDIYYGMQLGAKDLGWSTSVLDANLSSGQQVTDVATAINEHRTAIASWSLDNAAVAGPYKAAQKAGIPVIGVESTGVGVTASVFQEYQYCTPGTGIPEQEAKFIAARRPGAKTIVIGGPTTVVSIVEDTACFTADAKAAGLHVIASANNTGDTSDAGELVAAPLITKYPDVQAIWDYNDTTALGASAALTSANMKISTANSKTGVIVIGQNADADAIQAIRSNPERLTLTVDPNNVATGLAVITEMREAIEHKKVPNLDVSSTIWDSANVSHFVKPRARGFTLTNIPLVKK